MDNNKKAARKADTTPALRIVCCKWSVSHGIAERPWIAYYSNKSQAATALHSIHIIVLLSRNKILLVQIFIP